MNAATCGRFLQNAACIGVAAIVGGCALLETSPDSEYRRLDFVVPVVELSGSMLADIDSHSSIVGRVSVPVDDVSGRLLYQQELEEAHDFVRLCNARRPEWPHAPVLAALVAVGDPAYRPLDDIIKSFGHNVPRVKIFAFHLEQSPE